MAMVDAVETRPGTDPDRASFTTALQAARDQLTAARGRPDPDDPADLLGVIGRAVLATLLPARRPRYSARKVKSATSRYLNRDDGRPAASTTITAIDITLHTPPIDDPPPTTPRLRLRPAQPQPPTRRHRVTALMNTDPGRAWTGTELADRLQVKPRNMLTQLAEWTRARLHHPHQRRHLRPRHTAIDPRHTRQPANYAALHRGATPKAALTPGSCPRRFRVAGRGGSNREPQDDQVLSRCYVA